MQPQALPCVKLLGHFSWRWKHLWQFYKKNIGSRQHLLQMNESQVTEFPLLVWVLGELETCLKHSKCCLLANFFHTKLAMRGMDLSGKLKLGTSSSLPHPHNPQSPRQDEALLNPIVVQDPETLCLWVFPSQYRALVFVASASKMLIWTRKIRVVAE